jgi:hypothetical protein
MCVVYPRWAAIGAIELRRADSYIQSMHDYVIISMTEHWPNITSLYLYIKRLSSVQQEVFTHRHDRHQTSVSSH